MSQNSLVIDNLTASAVRQDINEALDTLKTISSGATAPASSSGPMFWYDTSSNWLKVRKVNSVAWLNLAYFDQATSLSSVLDDTKVVNTSGTQTGLLGDQTTGTWQAGTGTLDSLVSPANVKAAILALAPVNGVGIGQTWQNVSGSRSDNVSYQNTTGKPIEVSLNYRSSLLLLQASSNNSTWVTIDQLNAFDSQRTGSSAIIPNSYYYRTSGATVGTRQLWAELR